MNLSLSLLCLLAGIGIPAMAAMNSAVGIKLGNVYAAATVLCFIAFVTCLIAFQGVAGEIKRSSASVPCYFYFAGVLVAFYILTITGSAKTLGLVNAIFLVLLGQMLSAVIIDHFGLFGAKTMRADLTRLAGLVMMLLGMYLARQTAR